MNRLGKFFAIRHKPSGGLNERQLVDWYSRYGFTFSWDLDWMVRLPGRLQSNGKVNFN